MNLTQVCGGKGQAPSGGFWGRPSDGTFLTWLVLASNGLVNLYRTYFIWHLSWLTSSNRIRILRIIQVRLRLNGMSRTWGQTECKLAGCMTCTIVVGGPCICELPGRQVEKGN